LLCWQYCLFSVSESGATETAQHSVHLISGKERRGHGGGTRRVLGHFVWLEAGSVNMAFSRPTHQQVTQTVSPLSILY